jgi:hypothetical protein
MANKLTYVGKVMLKAMAISGEHLVISDEMKDAVLDLRTDYTVTEAARILIGELGISEEVGR